LDAIVVFLEHSSDLLGSIDGACGRHPDAFEEKGELFLPVAALAYVVEQIVVSLSVLLQIEVVVTK